MKKIIVILLGYLAVSCGNNDSLQKYFIESSEKPNFTQIDISPSSMIDENIFSDVNEKELLKVVEKINILFYQKKDEVSYQSELERINRILSSDKYDELMRVNSEFGKAKVKSEGDLDNITELVVDLSHKDKGFLLVRIVGNDISPKNLYELALLLERNQTLRDKVIRLLPFKD